MKGFMSQISLNLIPKYIPPHGDSQCSLAKACRKEMCLGNFSLILFMIEHFSSLYWVRINGFTFLLTCSFKNQHSVTIYKGNHSGEHCSDIITFASPWTLESQIHKFRFTFLAWLLYLEIRKQAPAWLFLLPDWWISKKTVDTLWFLFLSVNPTWAKFSKVMVMWSGRQYSVSISAPSLAPMTGKAHVGSHVLNEKGAEFPIWLQLEMVFFHLFVWHPELWACFMLPAINL